MEERGDRSDAMQKKCGRDLGLRKMGALLQLPSKTVTHKPRGEHRAAWRPGTSGVGAPVAT